MTVTKDQAQMLATLAAASRPNGARRWDTAGTLAAIAKVADRSLASVILATIRAAADRDVDTPGVIPTAGSHWQEQLAPQPFTPRTVDPAHRCSVCYEHHDRCRAIWADDHDFESVVEAQRRANDPDAVKAAVDALREDLPPVAPPLPPRSLEDLAAANPKLHAKVDAVRAALPKGPPMREEQPPPVTTEPESGSDQSGVAV